MGIEEIRSPQELYKPIFRYHSAFLLTAFMISAMSALDTFVNLMPLISKLDTLFLFAHATTASAKRTIAGPASKIVRIVPKS
jgi:hypothetical protein